MFSPSHADKFWCPPTLVSNKCGWFPFPEVKLWGLEADHLSPSDNDVEAGANFTSSIPRYVYSTWWLTIRSLATKASTSWIILLRLHLKRGPSVLENVFLVIAKSFLARIFVMGSAETSRGLWLGWQWADGTIGLGVQCKNGI